MAKNTPAPSSTSSTSRAWSLRPSSSSALIACANASPTCSCASSMWVSRARQRISDSPAKAAYRRSSNRSARGLRATAGPRRGSSRQPAHVRVPNRQVRKRASLLLRSAPSRQASTLYATTSAACVTTRVGRARLGAQVQSTGRVDENSAKVARAFGTGIWQNLNGGSVLLEATAPAEAIIDPPIYLLARR